MSEENQAAAAPAEPAAIAPAATDTPQVENAQHPDQAPEQQHAEGETAASTEADDKHKRESAAEKRIAKLIYQRETEKARADHLESLMRQQATPATPASPQQGRPQQSQYASAEDFVDAMADWKLAQRDSATKTAEAQKTRESAAAKAEKIFSAAEESGTFDRADFGRDVKITDVMADAILDSDVGAKLVLHFHANPAEAERIAALSGTRQAVEIGKLEAKLAAGGPKPSKAPPPIDPITGGTTQTATLANADMDTYIAMRKKQGARWAR